MGYAGNVINDDVIYDGPKELNQLTYKYDAGNGFTVIISLEDSNSSGDTSSYGGSGRRPRRWLHNGCLVAEGHRRL
jgi:hypothetical protein